MSDKYSEPAEPTLEEERDYYKHQLADLTARLKQAEAERDEALKMAERIDEALKKIPAEPADYSRELQSTDDWIAWCKKQEPADWYGINFHLGLRSGIVYGNILFSNILIAAKSDRDAAIAKLADVEKERDEATRQRERVDKFRERLQTRHRLLLNDLGVTKDLCDALQSRLADVEAGAAVVRQVSRGLLQACHDEANRLANHGSTALEKRVEGALYAACLASRRTLESTTAGTELLEDLKTLRTALEQYADPGNWHVGSKYDGESSSFTGPDEARKALDETERGVGSEQK